MRSGGSAVHQTLTSEAASVLKHSLNLARRRGHAQVTPLHVAATLLTSRTSLLRRACLKSHHHHNHNHNHNHPLQCRALELCFNVALNRLPTTPGPLLHGHPSLSNALIAALKRAQAHQRRGYNCLEQQSPSNNNNNQPLLTIKVELEQLVISILDDPSVSRVMREAGFSSTAVKNNVEDYSSASSVFNCYTASAGVYSCPSSPPTETLTHPTYNPNPSLNFWQTHFLTYSSEQNPLFISPQKKIIPLNQCYSSSPGSSVSNVIKEDIKLVFEVFLSKKKKKKNTVIVGDSVSITEGLVEELMGRLERGDVPDELKQTHFIKFQFAPVTLRFMKKEDVEIKLNELKRKLDYCYYSPASSSGGTGAIIYTGDLKWTVDDQVVGGEISGYSAVNHLVTEIGKFVSENSKVWLVATASYQTYMRCQMRKPSLEIQWGLQAVSVPSAGLGLSLHSSSGNDLRVNFGRDSWEEMETKPKPNPNPNPLSCKEDEEAKLRCCAECVSSYENEAHLLKSGQKKLLPPWLQSHNFTSSTHKDELVELRRKWNRLCQSLHQGARPTQTSDNSLFNKGKSFSYATTSSSSYPWWPGQRSSHGESSSISFMESTPLRPSVAKFRRQQSCTIEFNGHGGGGGYCKPITSLDSLKKGGEGKEENITLALSNNNINSGEKYHFMFIQLQENIAPWKCDEVGLQALADCNSGEKKVSWLMIEGNDTIGKRRFALAIAELVLGSSDFLLRINMRRKDEDATSFVEKITGGLNKYGKMVVLVEDIDFADTQFIQLLSDRIEPGKFGASEKIMFILTKGDSSNYDDYCYSVINMNLKADDDRKRKSEWDFPNPIKVARFEEERIGGSTSAVGEKDFSRQSSFNSAQLDLNIKANEEEGELIPISSDLTGETTKNPSNSNGFLDSIQNRLVLNRNSGMDEEIKRFYLSRLMGGFENSRVSLGIEERLLQELSMGSGSFVNSLLDKWVKDVFKTTLETLNFGEGIRKVRLCSGGKNGNKLEYGFKDTCLPRNIQNYIKE